MTTYNQTTLKTFFETNDVPTGNDYANFIDSCINVVNTSVQTMGGPLNPTELITARVSATNGIFTGNLGVNGTLSANIVLFNSLTVSALSITTLTASGVVSAQSFKATTDVSADGTVYASAMRSVNGFIGSTGIVSAAGTTQAAAAVLTNIINRGKGIADGVTTGFTPLANRAGLVQYLYNEGVSANLWPPTGGTINGLAVNAAFALVASASYTIFAITASAYGVK